MKLHPLFGPGDPFGGDPARHSEPIKLVPLPDFLPPTQLPLAPSPDPLGNGASSGSTKFEEIKLVPLKSDDYFSRLGSSAVVPSTSTRSYEVRLAPLEKGSDVFSAFGPAAHDEPDASFTKGAPDGFAKFCQFTKVQEQDDGNIAVYGIATHEKPDLDGEICDYDTAKDAYQAWSLAAVQRTSGAGQQISLGPIRFQHSTEPAGKAVKINYEDDAKEIWLGSIPINDEIRQQLHQGFLTGYSQGGSYAWRKCADCDKSLTLQQANNYCPNCKKQVQVRFGLKRLAEVSYVDSPCTGAGFEYVKRDGSSKFVSFTKRTPGGTSADGVQVLDAVRIFGKVWKHTVQIAGRKRTVVMRDQEIVLVA